MCIWLTLNGSGVFMHLEVIDGAMHNYDVLVYTYWGYRDHFDIDHHDYYDAYLKILKVVMTGRTSLGQRYL